MTRDDAQAQTSKPARSGKLERFFGVLPAFGRADTISTMDGACVLIGIGGGTGAGKSTFARAVLEQTGSPRVGRMEMDWYYRDMGGADPLRVNFDAPESYDLALLVSHLRALKRGESVLRPVYDYRTHRRAAATEPFGPFRAVLLEGILTLAVPEVAALLDERVYIDLPDDERFARRLERDQRERGRTAADVRGQWEATVQPMFLRYIAPSRCTATLIVPGRGNEAAVEALAARLRDWVGPG